MSRKTTPKVKFIFNDVRFSFTSRNKLKSFITGMFDQENTPMREMLFIFCSDAYLLQINQTFLKHDYYTDIITFDLTEGDEGVTGEVYISIDRVKENAKNLSLAFGEELLRVVFHGVLHLCGYKDKRKADISRMRAMETHYLESFYKVLNGST